MSAEFVFIVALAMTTLAGYCGSAWSATSPIRHHAEWIGAIAGWSAIACISWLVYLIATGKT